MELHYHEIEYPSTQTMLFLHEGLGCTAMWKEYPQKVCESIKMSGIIYDRSGYGKSIGNLKNRTANYLHEAAEELNDFINYLKLDQVILYGHSDGGSIALIYAAKYPEKVKALITEAAHVFNEPKTKIGVKNARPLLKLGKMNGLQKYHGDRFEEVFFAWNDIWLDKSFKNWDITSELGYIVCPNLVIQGKDDQYGTLGQVNTIKKLTQGKTDTFTPEYCGHAPHKEQTQAVLEQVIKFCNELN